MQMRPAILGIALSLTGFMANAETPIPEMVVESHILPGYRTLAMESAELAQVAARDCAPDSANLRAAYGAAFDAWIGVSHLRFGPSEVQDRAFALAFWPDSRGATPKALGQMIRAEDPAANNIHAFADVSIAARGFHAMEFLLYDPGLSTAGNPSYRCQLVKTMAGDIAASSAAILNAWETGYAEAMRSPGNDTYRNEGEANRQLFTALVTGLEFTSDMRLGRPLGTFDKPRPTRAEARRSGRSLRHVTRSLGALRELAALLSGQDAALDAAFDRALKHAATLDDPDFAGVADPARRFRVETLKQRVAEIQDIVNLELGPTLGLEAGFNSLDGD